MSSRCFRPEGLTGYEAMKERARARNAELSETGRDIGELPEVVSIRSSDSRPELSG